jgi:hypothetical protein
VRDETCIASHIKFCSILCTGFFFILCNDVPSHVSGQEAGRVAEAQGWCETIAVGEVWLRFCSICAIELCSNAGPGVAPVQLGVGVAGGAQCIGHALRAGAAAHADHVTSATDFRNAFNTISRDAVLAAVAKRHAQLFPIARWSYSCTARLWVHGGPLGHELLWSTTGVPWSDPIRTLLFALGLQGPLEDIVRDVPEVRVVAYLEVFRCSSQDCSDYFTSEMRGVGSASHV